MVDAARPVLALTVCTPFEGAVVENGIVLKKKCVEASFGFDRRYLGVEDTGKMLEKFRDVIENPERYDIKGDS